MSRTPHSEEVIARAAETGIRTLDTAVNYAHFNSHRMLARCLARTGLSDIMKVQTKVGYYPGAGGTTDHDLNAKRLKETVLRICDDLEVAPSRILIHNPEDAATTSTFTDAASMLRRACETLQELQNDGVLTSWGIATWDSIAFARLLKAVGSDSDPITGHCLMTRCGIFVSYEQLQATALARDLMKVPATGRLGMSPFAGNTEHRTIESVASLELVRGRATPHAAALRLAFELPECATIAVGVSRSSQLAELTASSELEIDRHAFEALQLAVIKIRRESQT